jgi:hypothetical protein
LKKEELDIIEYNLKQELLQKEKKSKKQMSLV